MILRCIQNATREHWQNTAVIFSALHAANPVFRCIRTALTVIVRISLTFLFLSPGQMSTLNDVNSKIGNL